MKLMYETDAEIKTFFGQEINEASGDKKYVIRGIFSSPGQKNKNGRVYPMDIWEKEVANYQKVIEEGLPNCLMEYEHPPYTDVDSDKAVGRITKLWIENGYVMGEAYILNSPNSAHLRSLVDAGIKLSLSSRGLGNVNESGRVTDYKLITFDIIKSLKQSDHNAEMYAEVKEGVYLKEDYEVKDDGSIVKICSKDKCLVENRDKVNEAIIHKFKEFFKVNEATIVVPDDAKEMSKEQIAPLKVPTSFYNVKMSELITILKLINHTDYLAKYIDVVKMIEKMEDPEIHVSSQVIRRINQDIRNKLYIQHLEDKNHY